MEVAIAILLALILVAMVSSNKAAADGVWKVVRWACIGGILFITWMALILYAVWFHNEYYHGAEWKIIAGIAAFALLPPFLLLVGWKNVVKNWRADRRSTVKQGAIYVVCLVGVLIFMPVYQEMKKGAPNLGWSILIFVMGSSGLILTWRSLTRPKSEYVWFSEPEVDSPWFVVQNERNAADQTEEALWNQFHDMEDISAEQREAFVNESAARRATTTQRLKELNDKLVEEKAARDLQRNRWDLRSTFWLSFAFACFGLIGIAWDYSFNYAMTLTVIKGREWLAAVAVVVAGFAAVGLIFGAVEEISSRRKKAA